MSDRSLFAVRRLGEADWEPLRTLRLRALEREPGNFFRSHAEVGSQTDAQWQALARGSASGAMFGLFTDARMIGITGVTAISDDPAETTARLVASYIEPEFRGRGLSDLLYEARLAWIIDHPYLERAISSHRRSNEASGRAMRRHGFCATGSQTIRWPDGEDDDELLYELDLRRGKA